MHLLFLCALFFCSSVSAMERETLQNRGPRSPKVSFSLDLRNVPKIQQTDHSNDIDAHKETETRKPSPTQWSPKKKLGELFGSPGKKRSTSSQELISPTQLSLDLSGLNLSAEGVPNKRAPTEKIKDFLSPLSQARLAAKQEALLNPSIAPAEIISSPKRSPKKLKLFSRSKKNEKDKDSEACRYDEYMRNYAGTGENTEEINIQLLTLIEQHKFIELKQINSNKLRQVYLRQSHNFEKEYALLRSLYRTIVFDILTNQFNDPSFIDLVEIWAKIVNKELGEHSHSVALDDLKAHPIKETFEISNDVEFSAHSMDEKVAQWEKAIQTNTQPWEENSIEDEHYDKSTLTEDELHYLEFLSSLGLIMSNSPGSHKQFFSKLFEAMKSPSMQQDIIDEKYTEKIILVNFFLYILQPLLFEVRSSLLYFDKIEIDAIESKILKKNNWPWPLDNAHKQLLFDCVLEEMKAEGFRKIARDNFFEHTLVKTLNKSFEAVTWQPPLSPFQKGLKNVQQQMIDDLLYQ